MVWKYQITSVFEYIDGANDLKVRQRVDKQLADNIPAFKTAQLRTPIHTDKTNKYTPKSMTITSHSKTVL